MVWQRMLGYCLLDPKEQIAVIFFHNSELSIRESASENVVCEMAAILSRGDELIFYANGITVFTKALTVVMVLLGIDTT